MARPRYITVYAGRDVIDIPGEIDFGDLHLTRRHSDGKLFLDWEVLMRICLESRIDFVRVRKSEAAARKLLVAWYRAHRALGGKHNAAAEEMLTEADLIEAYGGGFYYRPGRA